MEIGTMNTANEIVLQGVLRADGTVELVEKPAWPTGPVEVVLRRVRPGLMETLDRINQAQEARGFKGRSGAQIDADLREARGDDEERLRRLHSGTANPLLP
jgi:hypothetical protein